MFQVLHSSAGAGKTHALVKHYLCLALSDADPGAYARILALTFTNKAAGEMRDRVLDYLEGLAQEVGDDKALADVRATLTERTGISLEEIRTRAKRTLKHMLHHWPQLAVSTIDAFTRRVVMPFARDLRLDSELRMTTEEELYHDQAVELLLEEAGNDHALTALLIATCEQLLEEERDWRVDKPLKSLTAELSKEQALEHLEQLRGFGNEQFIAVQHRLRQQVSMFRGELRSLGRSALDTLEGAGLTENDLAYGKGGPIGYLRQLATFDVWLDEKKNTLKTLESGKWWSAKADPSTQQEVEALAPLLHDTIARAEELRTNGEMRQHALRASVLRDLLPAATLHLIDDRLERIKREEGVAFFSDLIRKVSTIVQHEPAPFLFERLGERYRHFLIDEFQDTSMLQWHALLPLLENALSSDGSALLVGDAKQAIYRWRNGEARQFVMLPELFGKDRMAFGEEREQVLVRSYRPIAPLAENYRSTAGIIAFNNALFARLRTTLPEDLQAVYAQHEQRPAVQGTGYIQVHAYATEDAEDDKDGVLQEDPRAQYVSACLNEALADGFLPGDVAVLVRSKRLGRVVVERLTRDGVEVVSPDGLSLGSDVGARAVMALFTWSHQRNDATAAFAVGALLQLTPAPSNIDLSPGRSVQRTLTEWSQANVRAISQGTLLARLHGLVEALAFDPATDAFILGLLNEAYVFTMEKGDDAIGFITHWERVCEKRSVAGNENDQAVKVMTIHASKGMQFPVVIIPDADMGSRGNKGEMLWIDPGTAVPELPTALVRKSKVLEAMSVAEVEEENGSVMLDELDLLYVACTRPEVRLYMGIPSKGNKPVLAALREHFGVGAGDQRLFGERAPYQRKKKASAVTLELGPAFPHERLHLALRTTAPEDWDPADPDPFRSHGRVLHSVLSRVRVAADLEGALMRDADAASMDPRQREELELELRALLKRPELDPFFREGLEVRTEVTIIDANGQAHRPDRIVRDENGTRILDLKTGAPREEHHQQVATYARLLAELGEPKVSAHLLYVRGGEIVDVT